MPGCGSGHRASAEAVTGTFLHETPFLLLDEPISSLDSPNEAAALREEKENRTVVLVPHRKPTVTIADRVYSAENGRMNGWTKFRANGKRKREWWGR